MTTTPPNGASAVAATTGTEQNKRTRRAEPINNHTAKNGACPIGSDRRRHQTGRVSATGAGSPIPPRPRPGKPCAASRSEVAAGTYRQPTAITVGRGVRRVAGRPARHPAGNPLQLREGPEARAAVTSAGSGSSSSPRPMVTALVRWMLTEARTSPKHYRPDSLAGRVAAMVAEHPEGITAASWPQRFRRRRALVPERAARRRRITRLRRGCVRTRRTPVTRTRRRETRCRPANHPLDVDHILGGGAELRGPGCIAAQHRFGWSSGRRMPTPTHPGRRAGGRTATPTHAKSWTLAEVRPFRESVRDHRLYACWLLTCYGLRRSEVLGLRWSAVDLDAGMLSVRRGRVAVGTETVEGAPKSRRSRRDLPLPAE